MKKNEHNTLSKKDTALKKKYKEILKKVKRIIEGDVSKIESLDINESDDLQLIEGLMNAS